MPAKELTMTYVYELPYQSGDETIIELLRMCKSHKLYNTKPVGFSKLPCEQCTYEADQAYLKHEADMRELAWLLDG